MPYRLDTLGSRVIVLGSLLAGITVFCLWFSGLGPFAGSPRPEPRSNAPEGEPLPNPGGAPEGPPVRYPALDEDPRPSRASSPDFDPSTHAPHGPSTTQPLLHLFRLLPEGTSVLGMVRLDALRKLPWASDLLLGRKLPSLRAHLTPLGLDLLEDTRAVLGIELEARPSPAPAEGPDLRFLGKLDRPFVLLVEGPTDRKKILQRFRRVGPLAATEILGRRVYRRSGEYAMTFPARGVMAWAYRRPMGPLLLQMLEAPARGAVTPDVWRLLEKAGLIGRPGDPARPAPPATEAPAPPPGPASPGADAVKAPPGTQGSPDEAHEGPAIPRERPLARSPGETAPPSLDQDALLPYITLLWTRRPGLRPPYVLRRLAGYGPKPTISCAVVTLGPGTPGGARVELRLFYEGTSSPPQMAALLRYARKYIAKWPRVRRAQLSELVESVPIQVSGDQIRVTVELQPWHVRALLLLFHKLLEGGS